MNLMLERICSIVGSNIFTGLSDRPGIVEDLELVGALMDVQLNFRANGDPDDVDHQSRNHKW